MKLRDVLLEKQKTPDGTYAAVKFDDDTKNRIKTFIEENEIPQPVPDDKLHTTLLYSRKYCPDYEPAGDLETPLIGTPTQFDVWDSQSDDDGDKTKCLVLQYDCSDLVDRHNALMDEHSATFDYEEYKPHITLTYNLGDKDVSNLDPSAIGDINIVNEFGEDLNFGWAKENT